MWSPTELLGCTWHAQNVLESAEHLLFFVVSVLPNFSLSLFFPSTLSLWITSSDAILIRVSVRKCSWCCRAHRRSRVDAARGWAGSFLLRRASHKGFLLTNEEDRSERVDVLQSIPGSLQRCSLAVLQRGQSGSETLAGLSLCSGYSRWSSRSHPLKQSSLCCRDWAVPQVLICWAAQKIICWQTATAAWKLKKKKKWNKTRS